METAKETMDFDAEYEAALQCERIAGARALGFLRAALELGDIKKRDRAQVMSILAAEAEADDEMRELLGIDDNDDGDDDDDGADAQHLAASSETVH